MWGIFELLYEQISELKCCRAERWLFFKYDQSFFFPHKIFSLFSLLSVFTVCVTITVVTYLTQCNFFFVKLFSSTFSVSVSFLSTFLCHLTFLFLFVQFYMFSAFYWNMSVIKTHWWSAGVCLIIHSIVTELWSFLPHTYFCQYSLCQTNMTQPSNLL